MSSARRRLRRSAAAVLVLSTTGALRAETWSTDVPPESASAGNDGSEAEMSRRAELAREQGHLGLAAYAEGRWRTALHHFEAAESRMHSPVFVLYAARCHHQLGDLEAARRSYERVVTERWPDQAPTAWSEARDSARQELAALPGATASAAEDAAPAGERVDPEPANTVAQPPHVDDPALRAATPPYLSVVRKPEYPYRTGAYAAFGVGLAGLVAGTVAGTLAWSKASEIRSRCDGTSCLASDEPHAHDARRLGHVATTGFVVAATGAVAGITLWLLPAASERPVSVSISPARASLRATF